MQNLIDPILQFDNLNTAWEEIRAAKGGAGIDGVTLARWGRNWEANLERLRQQVRTNTYHPNRPKRFTIRKKGGGTRELCRLTITDKVLQRAVLNVLAPAYEARFLPGSHGYRVKRSVATAVQQVLELRDQGLVWVLDADIHGFFEHIDHEILMQLVERVVSDWFVLNLFRLWLKAGRRHRNQPVGIALGAVISPLMANIYLHQLDAQLSAAGWRWVRYADDFLILAKTEDAAAAAQETAAKALERLKLDLSAEKTRVASFDSGFDFLGVRFEKDSYSYLWQDKRVTVKGRKMRALYRHLPEFYNQEM